jgi:drug/metabolite transporter (DMT)-like permease
VHFFNGIAVKELPPFTIVFVRVALAAALLWPVLKFHGLKLPSGITSWIPFIGMGLLNNVISMSLIVTGQTHIAAGMASVLNATTPFFTVLVLASYGDEHLTSTRIVGVAWGFVGVMVFAGQFYWRVLLKHWVSCWRKLVDVDPLLSAAGQLTASGVMMALLAAVVERPWQLPLPGPSNQYGCR